MGQICIQKQPEKKKINRLEITVSLFKVYKKVNQLQKAFESAELLTKASFFLLKKETVLKMAKETKKRDVESICAKVTKNISKKLVKVEVNLN